MSQTQFPSSKTGSYGVSFNSNANFQIEEFGHDGSQNSDQDLDESSLLLDHPIEDQQICSRWSILQSSMAGGLAVGLVALRVFGSFTNPVNTFLMGLTGMAAQYSLQQIKPIANIESHIISDYGADIFLTLTQIIINIPENPIDEGIFNGVLYALFGAQTVRIIDSLYHLTLKEDRFTATSSEQIQHYIKIVAGNTTLERVFQESAKIAIGTTFLACGYVYSKNWEILAKLGWLTTGHAIGGVSYELIHVLRKYCEEKHPVSPSVKMHHSVFLLRLTEKVSYIFSIALTGILLGINSSTTDFIAGFCTGISRCADMIHYTKTPVDEITELQTDPNATNSTPTRIMEIWKTTYSSQIPNKALLWATIVDVSKYLFGFCGVGAFIIWNMVIGSRSDRLALGIGGAVLYSSYLFSRWINAFTINEETHPLASSAFFYTNYSLLAPLLYVAIDQWMNIGDIALNTYGQFQVALDIIAWSSLGWGLGTHAAKRSCRRQRPYPAPVSAIALLLSGYWWFKNVLPTS